MRKTASMPTLLLEDESISFERSRLANAARICPWQIELSMQQRAGPVKDLKLLWFLERLFPGDSKVVSTLLL